MQSGAELHAIAGRLRKELAELDAEDKQSAENRATVMLDQQSVGRLSRMDALQRQAMAEAAARRRTTRRRKIAAALQRIEDDDFGWCAECGDEIGSERLALDPTVPTCISCARG